MRADIHDGPEQMLQSKAGYIDARPLTASSTKISCNARPDHTLGSKTEIGPRNPDFRSSLNSRHAPTRRSRPKSADIAPRLAEFGLLGHVGNQASTENTGTKK